MAANDGPEKENEVKETVRSIQKCLECPICLELLDEPYRTGCQHQFCKNCIQTVISSNKTPKCPLCKENITRRGLSENAKLKEIVSAVKELEAAVLTDTGLTKTPPRVNRHTKEATGTPGIKLHSSMFPTPHKPCTSSDKNI